MRKALCAPRLGDCELAFRINMVKERLRAYPLDKMNFIMMDLERPARENRHADWWTGDLTGRILEFMSFADGVTEKNPEWVHELFERALRTRQNDNLFGALNLGQGHNKLLIGLLRYYERYADMRALDAAIGVGNALAERPEAWMRYDLGVRVQGMAEWMTESFAELYLLTGEQKWIDLVEKLDPQIGELERRHAHNYLTALRGLQHLSMYTGDARWTERPERTRKRMIDEQYVGPAGDICEGLPWTERNEACATADWIRVNLCSGYMNSDDLAYEEAEHALLNALYFAQIVTGGMGHRALAPWGYGVKEFQEAWWCCTMNGGMAMADVARHAATLDGDTVRINFLLPGVFTLTRHGKSVEVRIKTGWPAKAEAAVEISGETQGLSLHVRVPDGVKEARCEEGWEDGVLRAHFSGKIGYTLNAWKDGLITLRHGVQLLAPMCYTIGAGYPGVENEESIPEGYRGSNLPSGWLKILPPAQNADGFYAFGHEPIPNWTYFEEGLSSRTGWSELSVNVNVELENGQQRVLRFWPLNYAISTLVFYATPIVFRRA